MDDDQLLHLAISVNRNPGVYALLLGSGISRSAGIFTGWEIMEDLIRQLASQDKLDNPYQWYLDKYQTEPTYDSLVGKFGRKSFERNALLRPYFEPTDEERQSKIKIPADAHKAIAKLVKSGFIRVILTTNFDRLLETALGEVGIIPDVISTEDGIKGARPLQHSPITIIKLHGDYLDGRIKNTTDELRQYEAEMDKLLDRVLDEYGLIVCGWSAEWDEALRNAFYRAPNRRYSTYWAQFGALKDNAKRLTDHRSAEVIPITGADDFFTTLEANVTAVQATKRQHPLSVPIAIERVKRLLASQANIELEDLLNRHLENGFNDFMSEGFIEQSKSKRELKQVEERIDFVMRLYFDVLEIPLNMIATLCWYGQEKQIQVLTDTLSRWMEIPIPDDMFPYGRLPVLLLIYAAGIAALERGGWRYIQAIFVDPVISRSEAETAFSIIYQVCEETFGRYPISRDPEGLSEHIRTALRPVYAQQMPSEQRFNNAFDLFEMLMSMAYLATDTKERRQEWMPHHHAYYNSRSWEYLKRFWQTGGKSHEWGLLQIEPFQSLSITDLLTKYVEIARSLQENRIKRNPRELVPDYAEIYIDATGVANLMRQAPVKGRKPLDRGDWPSS